MEKDSGGPAFPIADMNTHGCFGMSLRDYFAAHAPITIEDAVKAQPEGEESYERVFNRLARMRIIYADAMLKARVL